MSVQAKISERATDTVILPGKDFGIDFCKLIDRIGLVPVSYQDNVDCRVFTDRDRHNHVVMDSPRVDEAQLGRLYDSFFTSGEVCKSRSRIYRTKMEQEGWPSGFSFITMASILQHKCFGVNDMRLMSLMTAWLYTPNFSF